MNAPRLNASLLREPVHLLATGFGVGLFPRAPGTAGSLLALVPCALVLGLSWQWKAAIAAAMLGVGVWICGVSARRLGAHDHPGIVLDEIAAMLTVTLFIDGGWLWLLPAFAAFRFFDIVKPWPIRDLDHRLSGGLGIMLDDQMAALYTGICLLITERIITIS